MAYSTSNPPALRNKGIGGQGAQEWYYSSTDAMSAVRVDGYITNAEALGMKAGDVVKVRTTGVTPNAVSDAIVATINANGSADLTDGSAVSGTNTD